MTQGQTERLIRDMREYAEEYRGSVLGDCLDALLQYVADLQGDNECLLKQRDAKAQVTMHCPRCEELAGQLERDTVLMERVVEWASRQSSYDGLADTLLGLRGKPDCTKEEATDETA